MTSRRRLWVALVVIGVLTVAAATPLAWTHSSRLTRTTGDEPQYLLSAISLSEDLDLDVSDERLNRRYEDIFHRYYLAPQQEAERADGRLVSPHDPLLPVLMAVPVRAGGWLSARFAVAAMAGVLATLTLWVAVRRFGIALRAAVVTVGAFSLAAPLAVYGTQVYPELPAALALTAAVAGATGLPKRRNVVLFGVAVIALPWLGVKYVGVAAAIAGVGLLHLAWDRPKRALVLGAVWSAAGIAYALLHQVIYGGWTAYARANFLVTEGDVMGAHPDYVGRGLRLVGLLVDRDFGLYAWAPVFLLAVPALATLARWRPPGWLVLAAPLAAGWLTATFVAVSMHDWAWPGRQVVVIVPVVALAVAWWAGQSTARLWAVAVTGAVGVLTYLWVLIDALRERITVVVDFDRTGAPWFRAVGALLPDYRNPSPGMWIAHVLWITVVALLAIVAWRAAGARRPATISRPAPDAPAPVPFPPTDSSPKGLTDASDASIRPRFPLARGADHRVQ
jgi:hypothetical protein